MDVVSNTSPLCYLILLELVDVVPVVFTNLIVPPSVLTELSASDSPEIVRQWATAPPKWLRVLQPTSVLSNLQLHQGELHAISLALELRVQRLLIDERAGRAAAKVLGIPVAGTLAVLDLASERGLLHLPDAIDRLRKTNFRISENLIQQALRKDAARRSK